MPARHHYFFVLKSMISIALVYLILGCSGAKLDEDEWRANSLLLPSRTAHEDLDTLAYNELRINEINARTGPYDWIEIINQGDEEVDLTGCFLSDDPQLPKQAIISAEMMLNIAPHSYLVIALSDATLGFKLGKADHILLSSPSGDLIDHFSYEEGEAIVGEVFARIPDGTGELVPSRVPTPNRTNTTEDTATPVEIENREVNQPIMTEQNTDTGSNQMRSDTEFIEQADTDELEPSLSELQRAIRINEIAAKGDPHDWVELYNTSSYEVSLLNLKITDQLGSDGFILDHSFTSLPAYGYLVIEISDESVGFKLGSDESFYLLGTDDQIIDSVDWAEGEADENLSFAREIDGSGDFVTVDEPTPGRPNSQ